MFASIKYCWHKWTGDRRKVTADLFIQETLSTNDTSAIGLDQIQWPTHSCHQGFTDQDTVSSFFQRQDTGGLRGWGGNSCPHPEEKMSPSLGQPETK